MANKVRPLNQEDWKRSQIRMPQEEYDRIIRYAELKKMSLNTAILALADAALDIEETDLGLNSKVQAEDSKNSSGIGMKKVLPVRTQIRIPPELHTRLVEEAHKNESSLNDAMIFYIEQGFNSTSYEDSVEKIPTEVLMMELASRMQGYSLTVEEITANKKAP